MQITDLERDALTGFKNRKAYYKDIDFIERDKEISVKPVGVVFADVNGLKQVNDNLEHEAGDELIASVAKIINDIFPEARKYRFRGMVYSDDLKKVESDISSQIKQEKDIDQVKYRIKCKDGTIKTVLDYGRFVHTEMYGNVYYVFINDILENK